MKNYHKTRFLRSPGLETIPKNAEKSDLFDGIDEIPTTTQKTINNEEKLSKTISKKFENRKNL